MAHARLSPSSAERWMTCPGSVNLCKDMPDSSSAFADEGSAAHALAETLLRGGKPAAELVGLKDPATGIEWTAEMLADVMPYVNNVAALAGYLNGTLLIEQKLPIGQFTGERKDDGTWAKGTADAVILAGDELVIADLKFGRGVVVEAENNKQLMLYALAAHQEFEMVSEFKRVRLIISQPRLHSWSEWSISVEDLLAFGKEVELAALACDKPDAPLRPSEKGCKFCKAKATCPALRSMAESAFDDIVPVTADEDTLAGAMAKVKLVEDWCKAVRAETEKRLLAGVPVAGFKLVQGKMGNRKWANVDDAEALLKAMKLKVDERYEMTLISPTTAEKLVGTVLSPKQWNRVVPLITRTEGSPTVVPESDKRPAIAVADASAFDVALSPADFV